jgi:hypothetical protein
MPSDDDLLARLNALKQSSVSLGTNYNSSITPASPPRSTDDLAARFARLGSASPSNSPQPSRTASTNDTHTPAIAPGARGNLEGVAEGVGGDHVEFNEEDERSLEELLGELKDTVGERADWDLSNKEQQNVGKLLTDMKKILPQVINSRAQDTNKKQLRGAKEELTDWESIEVNIGSGGVTAGHDDHTTEDHNDDEDGKKPTEDEEADDLIARVMAELEISRKYDPPSPPPENDDASDTGGENNGRTDRKEDNGLSLPSAPTSLPEDDLERTQAIEDAFTARLAALSAPSLTQTDSLGLPSAPSFSPRKKPPIQSSLQSRLDDEIDTWCIICQDDATLKCLGCDGDLYCQLCWTEGHRGEGAGFEERGHKVVLYARKKKQAAA